MSYIDFEFPEEPMIINIWRHHKYVIRDGGVGVYEAAIKHLCIQVEAITGERYSPEELAEMLRRYERFAEELFHRKLSHEQSTGEYQCRITGIDNVARAEIEQ